MTNSEMDELLSNIKDKASTFFENVSGDTYAVEFRCHSNEIERSYTGNFELHKVISRSPTGRLTFQKIGVFRIGGSTSYDRMTGRHYWVPFIDYSCQNYLASQSVLLFLIENQSLRLRDNNLELNHKTYIKRFILGAEHQRYLLSAIFAMQTKYCLSIISWHTSVEGSLFKIGVTLKDSLGRTFVIHFQHETPYSVRECSTLEMTYNAFVFLSDTGSGSEVGASTIVIEKDKYNLGSFEEKFAADISP